MQKQAGCIGAAARFASRADLAPRAIALRVLKCKGTTVEGYSYGSLAWAGVLSPEQVKTQLNLRKVAVAINLGPSELVLDIPGAIYIICHDFEPVNCRLEVLDVKILKIPVACRQSHGDTLAYGVHLGSELFYKLDDVLIVGRLAMPVLGNGIFPVNINTIKSIFVHHLGQRFNKRVGMLR